MEAQSPEAQGGGREPDTPDGAVGRTGLGTQGSERAGGEAGGGGGLVLPLLSLVFFSFFGPFFRFIF